MKTDPIEIVAEGTPAPKPVGPQKSRAIGVLRYKAYRDTIRMRALRALGTRARMQGLIKLTCQFGLPVPDSWSPERRADALMLREWPTGKPDLKNLIAGVEDALNGVAWGDDSQVVIYGPCWKAYRQTPSTYIRIDEMDPETLRLALFGDGSLANLQTYQLGPDSTTTFESSDDGDDG